MHILRIHDIPGPNVYSHDPVLVMSLDLGNLAGRDSTEFPQFIEALLELLPGIHEHHCALGRCGGFVERLYEGTWFGHIVEHVALELTDAVGISVNRGKTVSTADPRVFLVAVTYKSRPGMECLLKIAVDLVDTLLAGEPFRLDARLREARQAVEDSAFGPSTQALIDVAVARGIPVTTVRQEESLVRLGHGKHGRWIQATITGNTGSIAVSIASDKQLTKDLLTAAGIPCPDGKIVRSAEQAIRAFEELGAPAVVKPLDGNQGRGVSLGLETPEQVEEAYRIASEHSPHVLVEQQFRGRDYRVLLVDGKLVAASEKKPAYIVGDGFHTVRDLIEIENENPRRGKHHAKPLSCIEIDPVMTAYLARSGRSLQTVPREAETILLRESANISTGGEATDVTDSVHPTLRGMFERAARLSGLDVCGLDVVLPDISVPLDGRGGIIEINAAPGIRMHCFPSHGRPRPVAEAIMDSLFPAGSTGRIPILAVTGTNGKTTVVRLIEHIIAATGKVVGLTTTEGVHIGGEQVLSGDMSGPWSARAVLIDPKVEVAVLETARGGIVRNGLGYDWSDVGVITNIQPDHLGQDGMESVEDILKVKSLVAERVRQAGTLVLNADDPLLAQLPNSPRMQRLSRETIFFALTPRNEVVRHHCERGGTAIIQAGADIEIWNGLEVEVLARVEEIPLTVGGAAQFQVANVLAAIAACCAYSLNPRDCAMALKSFRPEAHNAGRLSLYAWRGRIVVLDYGHNPRAIEQTGAFVSSLEFRRRTVVLGLPGDRNDSLLADSALAARPAFDRFVLRDDRDLRGRRRGEVPKLIEATLSGTGFQGEIFHKGDEVESLQWALEHSCRAEIITVFYDELAPVQELLHSLGAKPVGGIQQIREVLSSVQVPA